MEAADISKLKINWEQKKKVLMKEKNAKKRCISKSHVVSYSRLLDRMFHNSDQI